MLIRAASVRSLQECEAGNMPAFASRITTLVSSLSRLRMSRRSRRQITARATGSCVGRGAPSALRSRRHQVGIDWRQLAAVARLRREIPTRRLSNHSCPMPAGLECHFDSG